MVSKQSWFAGRSRCANAEHFSRLGGSQPRQAAVHRYGEVSFGMLFDCMTLSSKHMLQVRCSSVEIKPSMNITNRGTAPRASLRGAAPPPCSDAPALADPAESQQPPPPPRPPPPLLRPPPLSPLLQPEEAATPGRRRGRRRRCPTRRRRRRRRPHPSRRQRRLRSRRRRSSTRPPLRL